MWRSHLTNRAGNRFALFFNSPINRTTQRYADDTTIEIKWTNFRPISRRRLVTERSELHPVRRFPADIYDFSCNLPYDFSSTRSCLSYDPLSQSAMIDLPFRESPRDRMSPRAWTGRTCKRRAWRGWWMRTTTRYVVLVGREPHGAHESQVSSGTGISWDKWYRARGWYTEAR